MISTKAIEIVPLMEDPFDYEEYTAKCAAAGAQILPEGIYAQKLGMLKAAETKYPHLTASQAYLMFIADIGGSRKPPHQDGKEKGCCGGGKVK